MGASVAGEHFDINDSIKGFGALQNVKTPDRTVAIKAAAYVHRYLEIGLAAMLKGFNSELRQKTFGGYGFLATMAAKIDLAAGLGVYNSTDRKNILTLNRVRNRFAHDLHVDTFWDAQIVELCDNFVLSQN